MSSIILAEEQCMLLGALSSLFALEDDFNIVWTATNGEEAIQLVHEHNPDVCIMDIEMPLMNGLEAAEKLREENCKIIILTTFARAGYFEKIGRASCRERA